MKSIFVNGMLFLLLQVSLSSCFDFEFPDLSGLSYNGNYGGGNYNYNYPPAPTYTASFGVDSIVQNTDSTATIWAYVMYDSTLIFQQRTLSYWKDPYGSGEVFTDTIIVEPDTINFRALPDSILTWSGKYERKYQYNMPVTNVQADLIYMFCIGTEFMEKENLFYNSFCITN